MSNYLYTDDLEKELADLQEEAELVEEGELDADDHDAERLAALTELFEEIGTGLSETLIPEDEFTDYAEQTARDLCEGDFDSWPLRLIDWDDAADELKVDYTEVDFDGTTYFLRS